MKETQCGSPQHFFLAMAVDNHLTLLVWWPSTAVVSANHLRNPSWCCLLQDIVIQSLIYCLLDMVKRFIMESSGKNNTKLYIHGKEIEKLETVRFLVS